MDTQKSMHTWLMLGALVQIVVFSVVLAEENTVLVVKNESTSKPTLPTNSLANIAASVKGSKIEVAKAKLKELEQMSAEELAPFCLEEVRILRDFLTLRDKNIRPSDHERIIHQWMKTGYAKGAAGHIARLYHNMLFRVNIPEKPGKPSPHSALDAEAIVLNGHGWVEIDICQLRKTLKESPGKRNVISIRFTKLDQPGKGSCYHAEIPKKVDKARLPFWSGRSKIIAFVKPKDRTKTPLLAETIVVLDSWNPSSVKTKFKMPPTKPPVLQLSYDAQTRKLAWCEPDALRSKRHHLSLLLIRKNTVFREMDVPRGRNDIPIDTLVRQKTILRATINLADGTYRVWLVPVDKNGKYVGKIVSVRIKPHKPGNSVPVFPKAGRTKDKRDNVKK